MRKMRRSKSIVAAAILASFGASGQAANAQQLTFNLSWGWQPAGTPDSRRDAAWWSLTNVLARYNAYGDFTGGNGSNVQAAYNAGVPTAQAGYGGWGGIIEYGGTWPNERVTAHELDHWLGSGTYGHAYGGARAIAIIEQFEGVGARVGTDGTHYWPYGMNYDNEWNELGARREVALMYATRADWGIGSQANPKAWNATSVTLAGSDAGGTSGFNHYEKWSDGTFAHANADYSTGAYDLRTPNGYPSWTFAGKSLTVNQGGRLLYNGWGHDGTVTIKNLTVDNATIRHDQYDLDTFRLAGNMTVKGTATVDAGQGNVFIKSAIGGTGSLAKTGSYDLTLQASNSYAGATNINQGTLRLSASQLVADYTFDNVSGGTVVNGGSGGAAMNGTLANGATIVAAGGGRAGNAVRLANGASVDINSGITDLGISGNWAVTAWVNTTTAGGTILSKNDGGWNYGNTAFYLGDGSDGGSGSQPAGVRWAGGFLNAQPGTASVTDGAWHQVTYVNTGGTYTIYVDGVAKATAANNAGFGVPDIGSLVRLGVANNPGDGAINFNGLMDGVQVYGQSLSAAQVAALYAGKKLGTLPTSTVVNIANGAALDVNGLAQEVAGLNGVAGSTLLLGTGGQLIVNNASDSTFSGAIAYASGGSIVKSGAGNLTLTGGNAFDGGVTINGGTLTINGQWALGGGVYGGATFNGGTLKYVANLPGTNGNADISRDSGNNARPVTIHAGGATIDTNGNFVTFASTIGNNGTGGLTKAGLGTLSLNAANTYSGATTVNAGTLRVLGSIAASSGVTVNNGGTLDGTGSVSAITLNAGGTLAPGAAGVGTLTGTSLLWNSDGTTAGAAFELGANDATSDHLVLTTLSKGSGSKFLFNLTGGTLGQTYTLITFANNAGFTAADFALASTNPLNLGVFTVDGNSVDFHFGVAAVPEPMGLSLAGVGALALLRRRRRRA